VGDGLAAGHLLLGALHVHVDPLMIARGLRELVDHGLIDGEPIGGTELRADVLLEVLGRLDDEHGRLLEK
jgi:hypothetical protein